MPIDLLSLLSQRRLLRRPRRGDSVSPVETPEPTPEGSPHDAKPSSAMIKIKKLSPIFGARVVSGFDTATPASAEEAATLRSLILEHKLLVLPGGDLSAEQLAALGNSLGLGPAQAFGAKALAPYMKVVARDVLALEYGPESPRADINLWHQDHSWRGAPTRFELSYAAVSPLGGDVLYADAVAAHASLSPRLKALLDGATNVTVLAKGYQNLDVRDPKYAEVLATHRPVAQPVVAVDALTGDTWLNVNAAYSVSIPEMGAAESAALLPMLCAHVAKPDHCVRVHYEPGDVVIFDNHRLQHYAVSDYWPEPRRVLRMSFAPTRIAAAVAPERDRPAAAAGPRAAAARAASAAGEAAAALAVKLAAGLRLLDRDGQSDLCAGFMSGRHPLDASKFLTPSHGTHWHEATPDAFAVYDGRAQLVGGRAPNYPSFAVPAAVYAARPDVRAIVHAHPKAVMTLCGLDEPAVLPLSEPSFVFYERVATLECDFFFGDDYVAKIVDALRDGSKCCVLFKNHSFLMVGASVEEVWLRCYMLHQSAQIQNALLAATGGRPPAPLPRDEILYHRRSYDGFEGCPPYDGKLEWAGAVRALDKRNPGWAGDRGAALARAFDDAVGRA